MENGGSSSAPAAPRPPHPILSSLSQPHHVQALDRFLDISRLLSEVETVMGDPIPTFRYTWNSEATNIPGEDAVLIDRDYKLEEKHIYDTSELTEENMWLKDIVLSDSSDSSDEEEMNHEEMRRMLRKYKQMKKIREKTRHQPVSYTGYSTSILAYSDTPFQLDCPSLDYSNKARREKKPATRKRKAEPMVPLSIGDMISALASECAPRENAPHQLLIEPVNSDKSKRLRRRTLDEIWNDASRQAIAAAHTRISRLEYLNSSRTKVCAELDSKENVIGLLKPVRKKTG